MPRVSDKAKLVSDLNRVLIQLAINEQEETSEFQELIELYAQVDGNRYFNEKSNKSIPKNPWLKENLFNLPDSEFKDIVRMSKTSFFLVVQLIQDNPVFANNSFNKQEEVWFQLAVVLNRVGTDGTGSSVKKNSLFSGVSYGSVEKFTERVFKAIVSLKNQFIFW